jgi:hypothetical protein
VRVGCVVSDICEADEPTTKLEIGRFCVEGRDKVWILSSCYDDTDSHIRLNRCHPAITAIVDIYARVVSESTEVRPFTLVHLSPSRMYGEMFPLFLGSLLDTKRFDLPLITPSLPQEFEDPPSRCATSLIPGSGHMWQFQSLGFSLGRRPCHCLHRK